MSQKSANMNIPQSVPGTLTSDHVKTKSRTGSKIAEVENLQTPPAQTFDYQRDQSRSTMRRQSGILVDVHSVLPEAVEAW
jgi:hypothetical protein